ncbi:ABC transporter ATP-binding protein [Geotoga petraea]|jgi:putative ABC transport system ATP-binding protein|uniref:ABC transporter ATP-binding protein n=1 Tax=Geotoga petraea TaxID=28234 RepID=A0A1G6Q158_9BACT|nr:ABC transporter ATP-binding protein [Geotoga petraea]MDK2946638.1 putative transport system ATP-binding protein [Geotoga sp.]TGG87001.1 ABC transporter ATP-binding protein [Geotoga petraea]SDC86093.1 putative ABC transport system ATP-binding protein [Geotoga petraea]
MIKVEDLSKIYTERAKEVRALDNVNVEMNEGEIISILGPSGSGKSTFLNCLSGIDRPTHGKIFIDDYEITNKSDNEVTEFRAKNMGFIFQFFNLIPVLNVIENVKLPMLINEQKEKLAEEKAKELLIKVGLEDKMNVDVSTLSGGEAQRVSIARALINEPKIVWADEPTGALDKKTGNEILELIKNLNETKGTSFIIVTHDPKVTKFSNSIYLMESGKLRKQ